MIIYGIKNCDTMKKAFKWLDSHDIEYTFHDYRADGVTEELLKELIEKAGLKAMINKRSTTWRTLSDEEKAGIEDPAIALPIMLDAPTLIKRPLLIKDDLVLVGFSEKSYSEAFKA